MGAGTDFPHPSLYPAPRPPPLCFRAPAGQGSIFTALLGSSQNPEPPGFQGFGLPSNTMTRPTFSAKRYRELAALCRSQALASNAQTAEELRGLAEEYEAKARALDDSRRAER